MISWSCRLCFRNDYTGRLAGRIGAFGLLILARLLFCLLGAGCCCESSSLAFRQCNLGGRMGYLGEFLLFEVREGGSGGPRRGSKGLVRVS